MAIIADKHYSLVDYAKQFDPSGQELAIAEVLSQSNDIIADALVTESSLDSGHEYAVRTGITNGTYTEIIDGIAEGTTVIADVQLGSLPAQAEMQGDIERSPFAPGPPDRNKNKKK